MRQESGTAETRPDAASGQAAGQEPAREEVEEVYARFKSVMEIAAEDEFLGRRLALADTTVTVEFVDAPGEPVALSLLLDRDRIEVVDGAIPDAEVRLLANTRDVHLFWSGELHLAMAIANGAVRYEGPVRKVLRIVPIARRLVERYAELSSEDGSVSSGERKRST